MRYLLDVNVLLAWGWEDHMEHRRVGLWLAGELKKRDTRILTSPIPELGFVRVSVQRLAGKLPLGEASRILGGLLKSLGKSHLFLPDDQTALCHFPLWCTGASQTTDAHLQLLAEKHHALLATLDTGIPGAFLIPFPASR